MQESDKRMSFFPCFLQRQTDIFIYSKSANSKVNIWNIVLNFEKIQKHSKLCSNNLILLCCALAETLC